MTSTVGVVIPTVGRPSLQGLLGSLAAASGPLPHRVVVVDDRAGVPERPVLTAADVPPRLVDRLVVLHSGGRGPAAARNVGWQVGCADCEWVSFVDDDVVVGDCWLEDLQHDLASADAQTAGIQGHLTVPLPGGRRPTDWERGTAGLAGARWITADMAYRRDVLEAVAGFDERFPRAFREDADLALRVQAEGFALRNGTRRVTHPVRPARWTASIRQQRGNADDPLMRRLHGPGWGRRAEAPGGRRARHAATTAAAGIAASAALTAHPRVAKHAAIVWLSATAEFAWARIKPGPRTPAEVAAMVATSVVIPPLAVTHWLRGAWRWRDAEPWREAHPPARVLPEFAAVLFDRDGTLVRDVAYNGDPARVELMPDAADVVAALRASGLRLAVVTNQSGIARGLISADQVAAVNARIDAVAGPFDGWWVCPHGPGDGCACRKPAAGLVIEASRRVGAAPASSVVIGDIGADVDAAESAGAVGILVPTPGTRPAEVAAACIVTFSLKAAAGLVLSTTTARVGVGAAA